MQVGIGITVIAGLGLPCGQRYQQTNPGSYELQARNPLVDESPVDRDIAIKLTRPHAGSVPRRRRVRFPIRTPTSVRNCM